MKINYSKEAYEEAKKFRQLLYRIIILVIIGIIILAIIVSAKPTKAWIKDADMVYIDDSKAYISISPHTIFNSQWITLNLSAKSYTGNVDMAFGFNTSQVKPTKAELYNPHIIQLPNITTSKTFINVTSISVSTSAPEYGNVYNTYRRKINYSPPIGYDNLTNSTVWGNITAIMAFDSCINETSGSCTPFIPNKNYTITWNTTQQQNITWQNATNKFDSIAWNYDNFTTWYYANNLPIQAGKYYTMRVWIDVLPTLGINNGKYGFAIKPSTQTLQQALSAGNLYYLDPWYNSSQLYRINYNAPAGNGLLFVNVSNTTGSNNATHIFTNGNALKNFTDFEVTFDNISTFPFYIDTDHPNGTQNTFAMVINKTISSSGVINIYYGNTNPLNIGNISTTFEYGKDFNDLTCSGWTVIESGVQQCTNGFLEDTGTNLDTSHPTSYIDRTNTTWSFFVKQISNGEMISRFWHNGNDLLGNGAYISWHPPNTKLVEFYNGANIFPSEKYLNDGLWHKFTVERRSSTWMFYLDNILTNTSINDLGITSNYLVLQSNSGTQAYDNIMWYNNTIISGGTWSATKLNDIPIYSNVNLTPLSPLLADTLNASFNVFVPDNTNLINNTVWYKNGVMNTTLNNSLNVIRAGNTTLGESWYYTITGSNGGLTYQSNSVIIGSNNSAPDFTTLSINPQAVKYNKAFWINASGITDDNLTAGWQLQVYTKNGGNTYLKNSSWVNTSSINLSITNNWSDGLSRTIYAVIYDAGNTSRVGNLTSSEKSVTFTSNVTSPSITSSSLSVGSVTVGGTVTITAIVDGLGATVNTSTVRVERPDGTIAEWSMSSSDNINWTKNYSSTSDVGTYYVRYINLTDDSGLSGNYLSSLSFSTTSGGGSGSSGSGGGGGGIVYITPSPSVKIFDNTTRGWRLSTDIVNLRGIVESIIDLPVFYFGIGDKGEWNYDIKSNVEIRSVESKGFNVTYPNNATIRLSHKIDETQWYEGVSDSIYIKNVNDEIRNIKTDVGFYNFGVYFDVYPINLGIDDNIFVKARKGVVIGIRYIMIFLVFGIFSIGVFISLRKEKLKL